MVRVACLEPSLLWCVEWGRPHWMRAMVSNQGFINKVIKLKIVHLSKRAAHILVFRSELETSVTMLTLLGS